MIIIIGKLILYPHFLIVKRDIAIDIIKDKWI